VIGTTLRKFQILFFLFVVMGLAISACAPIRITSTPVVETGQSTKSSAKTTPTIVPTTNVPVVVVDPAALNELQIQFIHPWTGDALDELVLMVDEFNQTNEWGIHVIMTAPGSAAMVTSKTWEGIANHQPPNVMAAPASFILAVDEREGLVVDLTPFLDAAGYGFPADVIEDFLPLFWDELLVDDERLGIPAQQSALLLAYNKTWAEELGFLAPPSTDEEFRSQMCAANASFLKDDDTANDGLGGWLINTDPVAMLSWLTAFGVDPRTSDGYRFSSEAGEAAFGFLQALKNDSCAWVGRTDHDRTYFANRQALVVAVWLQDLPALVGDLERAGSQDEWTLIPFPGGADQVMTAAGIAYAVLQNDPAEDLAAWLFIRWLSEPAQQARLLDRFGTLPLSGQAEALVDWDAQSPQLKTALQYRDLLGLQPVDADWMVIIPALEDAGWQLLKAGIPSEQIPQLLTELDALILELAERYP